MGMTILGRDPNSKIGETFYRNIWKWSALWGYCASVSRWRFQQREVASADILPANVDQQYLTGGVYQK
jgi:hypothetical protein